MQLDQLDTKMSPEELRAQIRRIAAMHSNHFSTQNQLADGSTREVEVYTYPVTIADKQVFFSMIIDETDRLIARNEIERRNRIIAAVFAATVLLQSIGLILLAKSVARRKSAERHLAQQLNFSRSLIDTMPNPVFFKDRNGRYLGCNDAYREFTGIPEKSLSGKNARELWPDEISSLFGSTDDEVFASSSPLRYEGIIPDSNGSPRNFISSKAPFFDENGSVAGLVGVITDITELKKSEAALRKSEESFRTFFEQHSVGFVITDRSGGWVRMNEQFCRIFGYSREEMEAKNWREVVSPEELDRVAEHIRNIVPEGDDSESNFEVRCVCKDGSLVDVSVSTKLLRGPDEEQTHLASIVQDITERKRSAKMLGEKARELELHQEAIIISMAVLAEFRDGGTGDHIERTKSYVRFLLEHSDAGRFYPIGHFDLISNSAVLHDIGKVGVPDHILLKQGPLTPEEFDTVKTHPIIGSYALGRAQKVLGEQIFLKYAREIIEYHHEKWDGSGYPYGLAGGKIPLAARIMAIADVYDALISERPYKRPLSHEEAVKIIASQSGSHFDPALVEIFLRYEHQFEAISKGEPFSLSIPAE